MKLRNLFYLLLALPLAFAACSDDTTDPAPKPDEPTVKDPVLTLTSAASVEVAAEGETFEITYTLENKKEGVELEATCEADWVEVVAGDKVSVTVAANEGEARETKVVVKYDTQSFEVALKQVAKGEEPVKPAEPKLTLTSESNVDVTAAGGEFEITYTLENKKDGVELEATCEAQWVTVTVGEKVKVVVEANEGDAREAKVVVAYEAQKFEVTYKQAKKEDVPVVPGEPVAFVPKKVTASHNNNMDAGNFVLNLFVDDAQRFEFDMYDKVSANDSYLTPGKYTSEDGSIDLKYSQLYVSKDNKTAMAAAELELGLNQEEWTFTLKGSYELVNGAKYTIDWTGSIEGFVDPTAPVVKTYEIVSFEARVRTADVWDIIMSEDDPMLKEVASRITIKLTEENTMYIPDGTYSVENGGILVNSSTQNGYSTWRHETTNAVDIQICEVKVANDLEAETSVIEGSIQLGLDVYEFKYEGKVKGFMYKELGDEGITSWDRVYVSSSFGDCKVLTMNASGFEGSFYLYKVGAKKTDDLAASVYTVGAWELTTSRDYCEDASSKINYVSLKSGEVVVEVTADGYVVTFDVIDNNETAWKGTYTGSIAHP
ncbi:MAG: hypothetical protein IKJ38_07415 [Alistipes sp.]|nr:hypothetical protein [Alistipes sp.]